MNDFDARNKAEWEEAIMGVFNGAPPQRATWDCREQMVKVLNGVSSSDSLNHTMLPGGGGVDIESAEFSSEHDCLELIAGGVRYICKPKRLDFEHFPERTWNSFFLLETDELEESGVYDSHVDSSEELLRLPDGAYMDRSCLDMDCIGVDENGAEMPVPQGSNLVVRKLKGKFLVVAKRSLWNLNRKTYDGRHSQFSASEIRSQIEAANSAEA